MTGPLSRQTLRGPWAALITPWTERDELDEERFAIEVRSYASTGVGGVYTGGTTGEFYAQDDRTFRRVTEIACAEARAAALPVQIGCTALSTRTVCLRIDAALEAGADGIQVALPFWLKLADEEVLAFFRGVAAAAGQTPFTLYHTARAKCTLSPAMIGRLAGEFPTFLGAKETGCDVPTLKAILCEAADLAIFGGDADLIEKIPAGGKGGYCAFTGLSARTMVELYEHCAAGRLEQAAPIAEEVTRMRREVLGPFHEQGLGDSAVDRVLRTVGGGEVGLNCQGPYVQATAAHVRRLEEWCRRNARRFLEHRTGWG